MALVTLRNPVFRLFRLFRLFWPFREIQGALAYPSDPFGQNGQKTRKTLLYGFWPSRGPLVPLDPDPQRGSGGPTPGRLNPPERRILRFQACILLVLQKVTVLAFLGNTESFPRKA